MPEQADLGPDRRTSPPSCTTPDGRYGICLRGLPGWGEQGAPLTR